MSHSSHSELPRLYNQQHHLRLSGAPLSKPDRPTFKEEVSEDRQKEEEIVAEEDKEIQVKNKEEDVVVEMVAQDKLSSRDDSKEKDLEEVESKEISWIVHMLHLMLVEFFFLSQLELGFLFIFTHMLFEFFFPS